jgi:RNA polymerase sigma-70 factor (ECF subfamily)
VQEGWPDEALRRGLLARDAHALEALIARYAREAAYFVQTVLNGVGTAPDVEECVSDLFVVVWEEIGAYDPARGSLRTWLTMRAKYLALDRRRQIQRRQAPTGLPSDAWGRGGEPGVVVPAPSESLEELLERRERHEQLRRALVDLSELDRLLIYLRYFRLVGTEEIAAKTGLTRRAIDTRLWRARKHLRAVLETAEERAYGHVGAL